MANKKTLVRQVLEQAKAEGRSALTAPEGKAVCDAYGIPVPKEGVATTAGAAAKIASAMGFPVVLKIVSPDILHKTEAGGVLVGLKTTAEVRKGFAVALQADTVEEADRLFNALSEGATITMPIGETFFSKRFGMLTDRFGTPWMVNCVQK